MVNMDKMPLAVDANYAVWTPDTEITLTNVPWDNNYRDIVKFPSMAARNQYIDSLDTVSTDIVSLSYARADAPIKLRIGMTEAYAYNYVRVFNPANHTTGGMYYYYFITNIEFLNPAVTVFTLQLDVWNTFGDSVTWGQSYIESGHIGIANTKAFDNYGRDYLTLSEGLDTGAEMRNIYDSEIPLMNTSDCWYMITTNISLEEDPGTVKNPNLTAASPSYVQGAVSGAGVYIFTSSDHFLQAMTAFANYPWIIQGIMQIAAIPDLDNFGYNRNIVTLFTASGVPCWKLEPGDGDKGFYGYNVLDWRNSSLILDAIPERYRSLKKFLTFPYMAIEFTAFTGNPVVIKPEAWNDDNAPMAFKISLLAGSQRVVAYPMGYNSIKPAPNLVGVSGKEFYNDGGDYLETSTSISNFPTFAIVSNAGVLAIASQAHALAQQYKTADWSQQKALMGNQTSFDQSSAGISNSNYQSRIGREANTASAAVANNQAVARGILGAGQGAISGGLAGAAGGGPGAVVGAATGIASGVANVALDVQARNAQLGITNTTSENSQTMNNQTSSLIRDTNKNLADWAAKGDNKQAIAAINAKVQDTALTPPFTAGQAGGESFNFINGGLGMTVRWKMITPAELRSTGEYWLRYGYEVRQFAQIPQSLMVMSNFTYWKLSETYIKSARIPEGFKQAIRGIMEKGVTVWVDPRKIGVTDRADNVPLSGVTL